MTRSEDSRDCVFCVAQSIEDGRQLIVHEGTLALVVAGQTHHVPAGGAALAATDRAHAYACEGEAPVRWTMAVHEPHRWRPGRTTA